MNGDSHQNILQQIKRYILEQDMKEGDVLEPETVLAKRFGVSRYKAQRALNTLQDMGFVSRSPRRGTVIKKFDPDALSGQIRLQFDLARFDVAEFTEARAILEGVVVLLVARRITPKQLAYLEQCIVLMENSAQDPVVAGEFDLKFHLGLFKATGNKVVEAFSGVLTTLFKRAEYNSYFYEFMNPDYIVNTIAVQHRALLQAIAEGDARRAEAALHEHLRLKSFGISLQ